MKKLKILKLAPDFQSISAFFLFPTIRRQLLATNETEEKLCLEVTLLHSPFIGLFLLTWVFLQHGINEHDSSTFDSRLPVTRTLDNSNLPLTRRNFHFPSDHFLYNFTSTTRTLDNSNFFLLPLKVRINGSRLWMVTTTLSTYFPYIVK